MMNWSSEGESDNSLAEVLSMAGLAAQILKRIISRGRPIMDYKTTGFLGPTGFFHHGFKGHFDSMPSGHTAAAFGMAAAMGYRWPRLKYLWYGLALGVGASRLLVGAHFPSDVILGACLGGLAGRMTAYFLISSLPLADPGRPMTNTVDLHPENQRVVLRPL
jgi:undecaprenyl-diphosphatase